MGVASQNSTIPCAIATFPVSLPLSSPDDVWPRLPLFLPPRGHEPPPTLRDRLNPNLSLYRHRFPIPRYAKRPDVALYTVGPFFLLPTPSSTHCVRSHAMHQSRSRMAPPVQLAYIICSKSCSWRDVDFVYRNEVYQTKSALSVTAFREVSSTAALMKLLLPIGIHVAVCDLQATHRPTINPRFTPTELGHSDIAATWCVEQRRCTCRRPPRCSDWFLKITHNSRYQSELLY